MILAEDEMLHVRCAAHVLNLIVRDGFKIMESATSHIRESVKYIKSSESRKHHFEEIIVPDRISLEKRPSLDVPTRWNSTYLMLQNASGYRTAFEALYTQYPSYVDGPSASEWRMVDKFSKIFVTLYDPTNLLSGSLYPTTHHYFHVLGR